MDLDNFCIEKTVFVLLLPVADDTGGVAGAGTPAEQQYDNCLKPFGIQAAPAEGGSVSLINWYSNFLSLRYAALSAIPGQRGSAHPYATGGDLPPPYKNPVILIQATLRVFTRIKSGFIGLFY